MDKGPQSESLETYQQSVTTSKFAIKELKDKVQKTLEGWTDRVDITGNTKAVSNHKSASIEQVIKTGALRQEARYGLLVSTGSQVNIVSW